VNEEQEDFSVKLLQIEQQAHIALEDLPPGELRNRIQFIATTAELLKNRLEVASDVILPGKAPSKPDKT
jgi:hypothetical protein